MRGIEARDLLLDAGRQWVSDRGPRLAAALAFYTILSLTPLVVIATAIVGFVFGEEAARGEVVNQLRGILGGAGAEVVQTALQHAHQPAAGVLASLLGLVTLLFGASGVFGELQDALNTVWKVPPKPDSGWWEFIVDRFVSFAMVLAVGFLLLVSLIISAIVAVVATYLETFLPSVATTTHILNAGLSLVVVTVLFALMFRYLPDIRSSWGDVLVGALLTAALFTGGKFLIGIYIGNTGVQTPFGAAGSLVAFVVWVYYSGLIFFYGAEVTHLVAERRQGRVQ